MRIEGPALRLTIFVTRTDVWQWTSVPDQIVRRARKAGLAGATILHADAGYAGVGPIRTTKLFSAAQDLPSMIIIVDREDRIRAFLADLDDLLTGGGLAVIERVEIVRYLSRPAGRWRLPRLRRSHQPAARSE